MGEKNAKKQRRVGQDEILERIFQIKNELALANRAFDQASSPEMVDSCIYKINSLQAIYAHFLRQAKASGSAEEPYTFRGRETVI